MVSKMCKGVALRRITPTLRRISRMAPGLNYISWNQWINFHYTDSQAGFEWVQHHWGSGIISHSVFRSEIKGNERRLHNQMNLNRSVHSSEPRIAFIILTFMYRLIGHTNGDNHHQHQSHILILFPCLKVLTWISTLITNCRQLISFSDIRV